MKLTEAEALSLRTWLCSHKVTDVILNGDQIVFFGLTREKMNSFERSISKRAQLELVVDNSEENACGAV